MYLLDTNVISEIRRPDTRQLTIVTRNVKHFAPTKAQIINPWEYKSA